MVSKVRIHPLVCMVAIMLCLACCNALVTFLPRRHAAMLSPLDTTRTPRTCLFMGKGLNRAKNKQAELARKMKLAKQQKQQTASSADDRVSQDLSREEIKERNDRLRFEELLKRESSNVLNAYSKDGYLSKEQEEEEITAARSGKDRLFEGDGAPTTVFEDLVVAETGLSLNKKGAKRLVPWLGNYPDERDYLVIITDPRPKSFEFRQTIQQMCTAVSPQILQKTIIVNSDSPAENRRWMKKNGITRVNMYCDEEQKFMQEYTALGEKRWAMCMFVIANGRIQKLARDVDPIMASRVIQNAVKSLDL